MGHFVGMYKKLDKKTYYILQKKKLVSIQKDTGPDSTLRSFYFLLKHGTIECNHSDPLIKKNRKAEPCTI